MEKVQALNVDSNDTVLFYYAGHGFRRDTAQIIFPEFDCRRTIDATRAKLSDISDYIRTQKRPRLVLIVADTCNVVIPEDSLVSAPAQPPQNLRKAALRRLFLGYKGGISASGSTPGNPSWYMNDGALAGGFFTNRLLRVIDQKINAQGINVKWQDIMADVTQPIAIPTNPPTTQIPQYEFQGLIDPSS
jgi:hypothetical protein